MKSLEPTLQTAPQQHSLELSLANLGTAPHLDAFKRALYEALQLVPLQRALPVN